MNPKRFSYLMIAVVFLLSVATIAMVAGGDILFKKQSKKIQDLKAQNQAIKEQEVSLAQAKADIEKYNELNQIAQAVVPQDKDQAKTVREINAIAAESGIKLAQINFESSNLGQASPAPSSNSSGESQPKTPQPAPSGLTQVKPVPGINGVYSLEITVSSGANNPVSYYKFLQFLEKLESNRRTAHVNSITVTPSEQNRNDVTFSLKINAYLKP